MANTLEKLKTHADAIMTRGAPFSKEDFRVLKIYLSLNSGKAFNSGKRNAKAENNRLKKGFKK